MIIRWRTGFKCTTAGTEQYFNVYNSNGRGGRINEGKSLLKQSG